MHYLVKYMPKLVNNYILITYDDLINNFGRTMNRLKLAGLTVKPNITFPLNVSYYKKDKDVLYTKKKNIITSNMIQHNIEDLKYYDKLFFPDQAH